jgi:hypothetical protein
LNCDPGGVNPPGFVVFLVVSDVNDECQGVFATFLGEGLGYDTYFDTGGYIPMTDEEMVVCHDIIVNSGYCG